jgi:hypothetical protein
VFTDHPGATTSRPVADRTAARSEAARDEAARVAASYRSLRKSLEDAKDEPGAADFY